MLTMHIVGIRSYASAPASKAALVSLIRTVAIENKDAGITANVLLPGTMDTTANRQAMPKADFSKWVKTEDVARVIHTLLGDEMRAVRSVAVPVLG